MSTAWIVVLGTGIVCFAIKYLGHLVPTSWLGHPRLQRINAVTPIVLLSALVAAETFTTKNRIVLDHRIVGVAVAAVAVRLKMPFPVIVLSAAAASALVVHLH